MEGNLDDDPTFPQGLTLFLVEGAFEEWDDASGPYTPTPKDFPQLPPLRTPCAAPPIQEEPGLKSQPGHLLVNLSPNPDQGWRNQILLTPS